MAARHDPAHASRHGVTVVWIYESCRELGLDGIRVIERVAAATREAAED